MNELLKKAKEGAGTSLTFQSQVVNLAQAKAEVAVLNEVFMQVYGLPRKLNQLRVDLLEVACANQSHTPLIKYSGDGCSCCSPSELRLCRMPALYAESMPVKKIEIERYAHETTASEAAANQQAHADRVANMRARNRALIEELSQVVQSLKDLEEIFDGEIQGVAGNTKPTALPRGTALLEQLGPSFGSTGK